VIESCGFEKLFPESERSNRSIFSALVKRQTETVDKGRHWRFAGTALLPVVSSFFIVRFLPLAKVINAYSLARKTDLPFGYFNIALGAPPKAANLRADWHSCSKRSHQPPPYLAP